MKIDDYSRQALTTLSDSHQYGQITPTLMAQVLGLVGESGEVADKFKKIIWWKDGKISEEDKELIIMELGDILWYVNTVSYLMGSSLEEVAKKNNQKLLSRKNRGKLNGDGDNR